MIFRVVSRENCKCSAFCFMMINYTHTFPINLTIHHGWDAENLKKLLRTAMHSIGMATFKIFLILYNKQWQEHR